ncbi:hypothetical protein V1478_006462, partial [Vespula squamosa]
KFRFLRFSSYQRESDSNVKRRPFRVLGQARNVSVSVVLVSQTRGMKEDPVSHEIIIRKIFEEQCGAARKVCKSDISYRWTNHTRTSIRCKVIK